MTRLQSLSEFDQPKINVQSTLHPSPKFEAKAQGITLAIDPGNVQSAWVLLDKLDVIDKSLEPNEEVRQRILRTFPKCHLAIERIASYGMPVGETTFATVWWAGRFTEAHEERWGVGSWTRVFRRDVKQHLCKNGSAKDPNVRQRLIDIYGPSRQEAIGKKLSPGPLYGFNKDLWAALGIGLTYLKLPMT